MACQPVHGYETVYIVHLYFYISFVILFRKSFCSQFYDIKYLYLILIIFTQLYGFKYFNQILIIIWFQVNNNNHEP